MDSTFPVEFLVRRSEPTQIWDYSCCWELSLDIRAVNSLEMDAPKCPALGTAGCACSWLPLPMLSADSSEIPCKASSWGEKLPLGKCWELLQGTNDSSKVLQLNMWHRTGALKGLWKKVWVPRNSCAVSRAGDESTPGPTEIQTQPQPQLFY